MANMFRDTLAPMSEVRALERQIAANPNDPDPYVVLGDHMLAAGDPHGQLVAIHNARRARPKLKKLVDDGVVDMPAALRAQGFGA